MDEEQIGKVIEWFNKTSIPDIQVKLPGCGTIIDLYKFVHTHISFVQTNSHNKRFQPYLDRLIFVARYLHAMKK